MKMHWLQDRVTFFAIVINKNDDSCVDYVEVGRHAFNGEAELQDLVRRHPGLAYVVQTRRLEIPRSH